MGNRSAFIVVVVVLLVLMGGCEPVQPAGNGVTLPTSAGTSAVVTSGPLVMPTLIEHTATPLPPEFPNQPGEFFFDDFSNRNSGWAFDYADYIIWDYYQGGYRVSMYADELHTISYLDVDYSNVRLVVDMRMIGGQAHNAFGLACRCSGLQTFYSAVINGEGFYGIYRRVDGGEYEIIAGNEQSAAINRELSLNLVEMSCVGDRIALTVNGQLLVEVTDSTIQSGAVGLYGSTISAESTDVLFDNFYLYLEE